MLVTAKPRIPFVWIFLSVLPWAAMFFKDKTMGIAFTYSMNKFVDNPAALTFVLTLPSWINWFIPPIVNFLSDRIWTRIGRRKPFVIASWCGTITFIALMPLAADFTWLLTFYMGFSIFNQFGGPVEALKLEVVPPAQRSLSSAVMQWVNQIAVIVFFWVAFGRFDEVTDQFGFLVTGETGLFWTVSIGMVVMLLLLTLGIKETDPHSALRGERFTPRTVFRGLTSPHLWPIYILACSSAFLGTGLGALNNLLITEQWGYTKQDLGNNIVIGGVLNLLIFIPLCGLFSNKVGRFRIYVILVCLGVAVNLGQYVYYSFILYDSKPTILEMVTFGEMLSVLGILIGMTYVPLVYDFIPRNEMGTYSAGSGLVTQVTHIITGNLVGLFVWLYATIFLGPAGEMTRVALRDNTTAQQVLERMEHAAWTDPASGQPIGDPHLSAKAWYATYAHLDHGRGFEIRIADQNSAQKRDLRDMHEATQKRHEAREKHARRQAGSCTESEAEAWRNEADLEAAKMEAAKAQVKGIDDELKRRAEAFRDQAQQALADLLLADGEQILAAMERPAVVATFAMTGRCTEANAVERTLDAMRARLPELVDLRIYHDADGSYRLEVSSLAGEDPQAASAAVAAALDAAVVPCLRAVLAQPIAAVASRPAVATRLDLRIIEDPLDRHPSPISRVVDALFGWAIGYHEPDRRLRAVGRGLRRDGWLEHAGATLVSGDDNAIRVTAVFGEIPEEYRFAPAVAAAATDAKPAAETTPAAKTKPAEKQKDKPKDEEKPGVGVLARLAPLGDDGARRAAALYSLALRAGAEKRMTVARPVLTSAYAKQEWNYLTGYLAILVLQCVGIGIIFIFLRMVKTGRVRRRGAEEAEAVR